MLTLTSATMQLPIFKASTIVNYDSGVVITRKLLIFMTIYSCILRSQRLYKIGHKSTTCCSLLSCATDYSATHQIHF